MGAWVGLIGCGVGALSGLVSAIGILAIVSTPGDTVQDNTKANENTCADEGCSPYPEKTIGFVGPKYSKRGKDGTETGESKLHYKHYIVGKNPKTCECTWQLNSKMPHHTYYQPDIFFAIDLNNNTPLNISATRLSYP